MPCFVSAIPTGAPNNLPRTWPGFRRARSAINSERGLEKRSGAVQREPTHYAT